MIPLTRLKRDVQFNQELTKVIDVLKGIAAARFHVLERQLHLFDRGVNAAAEFVGIADLPRVSHPFAQAQTETVGALIVTSDTGFLGGLNTQVVNAALREVGTGGLLTVVGERGASSVRESRREATVFPGIEDATRTSLAAAVTEHLLRQVLEGACGRLVVAYPRYVSSSSQQVTVEVLLPCSEWSLPAPQGGGDGEVEWESSVADVVEYVVTQWLGSRLEQIFSLSRLAELAARMIHLEGSYQELMRQGKAIKFQYFRARHEVIDRSMREIFAAQLLSRQLKQQPVMSDQWLEIVS